MSRAAQKKLEEQDAINKQYAQQASEYASQAAEQAEGIPSAVSSDVQSAMIGDVIGGTTAATEAAQQKMARRAAATGAVAGAPEAATELTRGKQQAVASGTGDLQKYFQLEYPMEAATAKANIYQGAAGTPTSLYGTGTGYSSNLAQQAYAPGLLSQLLSGALTGASSFATSKWGHK